MEKRTRCTSVSRRIIGGLAAAIATLLSAAGIPAAASCTPNATTNVTVDAFRSDHQPPIQTTDWQAQTFTVLGSGCFTLDQVTVNVRKHGSPGNLVVEIYDAVAGSPALPTGLGGSATPLASASVSAASVSTAYGDIIVPFSSPPQISGGAQYAVVVHQNSGSGQNYYQLGLDDNDPYSGGRYCKSAAGPSWDCPSGPGGGLDVRMSVCVSACDPAGCTLTQGYWKTHPGTWPAAALPMLLGTVSYNETQLLAILNYPVGGNGLISLAHQLIAAKLNQANGASAPAAVQAAISSADTLIGGRVVPPVGSGFLNPASTDSLTQTLDQFNSGLFPGGPPHCP